jgi:hypothetical protein
MPSCRHSGCDGIRQALSSGNVCLAGCDDIAECRHNLIGTGSNRLESSRTGHAVTRADEIGLLAVHFPTPVPVLTPRAARTLLGILVELTEVPVPDKPGDGVCDGC